MASTESQYQDLLDALTVKGLLGPAHLRIWARIMRKELGYRGSMIEDWLSGVADALEKVQNRGKEPVRLCSAADLEKELTDEDMVEHLRETGFVCFKPSREGEEDGGKT